MISEAVKQVFEDLVPRDPEQRETALRGIDPAVARIVGPLLEAIDCDPGFLEKVAISADEGLGVHIGAFGLLTGARLGPGVDFGDFRIMREVGRGGMGIVYEAQQRHPNRRVALKFMKHGVESAGALRRFRREGEALARLNHPGIATVFEARIARDQVSGEPVPYIAMEFVDGVSITRYARDARLSPREVARLIAEVCDAVDHAHQAGIVHRDLSPSNILVDPRGRAKVLDFGVAQLGADGQGPAASMMTSEGGVVGKWQYMSPEQAAGARGTRVHPRMDVFSLGALLYELLAEMPWLDGRGKNVFELIRAIERDEPVPLGRLRSQCKGDLQAITATAMRKDPVRRYASAGELRDDLRRFLSREPVRARDAGSLERAAKFVARHRALSISAAATTLALIVGLSVALTQAVRASRAERATARTLREVLDGVVTSLEQSRAGLEVRAAILERVKPEIDRLSERLSDDESARLAAAKYYMELAKVVGYPYAPNLGRMDEAIDLFRRSAEIAAPRGVKGQRNEELALHAAEAIALIGRSLSAFGRGHESLHELERTLDGCRERIDGDSTSPWKWAHRFTDLGRTIVSTFNQQDRRGDADRLLAEMRAIAERADHKDAPPDLLGGIWHLTSQAAREVGDFEASIRHGLRSSEALDRADPPNADISQKKGNAYRYIGLNLMDLGRAAEAVESFDRSLEAFEASEEYLGQRSDVLGIRAQVHLERARARADAGDSMADEDARRAVELRRLRLNDNRASVVYRTMLAQDIVARAGIADHILQSGLPDSEAMERWRQIHADCMRDIAALLVEPLPKSR